MRLSSRSNSVGINIVFMWWFGSGWLGNKSTVSTCIGLGPSYRMEWVLSPEHFLPSQNVRCTIVIDLLSQISRHLFSISKFLFCFVLFCFTSKETWSPWSNYSSLPCLPVTSSLQCLYRFAYCRYCIEMELYTMWPLASDFFHLA